MSNKLIAPSILAADFGNLQRDVEMVNQSDADCPIKNKKNVLENQYA